MKLITRKKQNEAYKLLAELYHLCVPEDIFKEATKKMPNISLGTVYRNLNDLTEEGQIARFHTGLGKDYYDYNIDPHGHLICKSCGGIKDYDVKELYNHLKGNIKKLISFEIEIKYICEKCQKNLEKEGDS